MDSFQSSASPATDQGADEKDPRDDKNFHEGASIQQGQLGPQVKSTSPFSSPALAPTTATSLSRAGTLSWQQRPSSRGSTGVKSRPLSAIAAENNAFNSPTMMPERPVDDQELSRDKIAQSLGSKDPQWFRQTADRGLGSAAYRKPPSDAASNSSFKGGSMRLSGLSKESTPEPQHIINLQPESARSSSSYQDGSAHGEAVSSQGYSSVASLLSAKLISSPLPTLSSHRLEPTANISSSQLEDFLISAKSRSPGQVSPERVSRPSSPTKGLGGFVQSAMLKRADSMNKRSSIQAVPSLSRENSMASNRGFVDGNNGGTSSALFSRDFNGSSISREASPLASSRPGSSHNNGTVRLGQESTQAWMNRGPNYIENLDFVKPAIPDSRHTTRDSPKETDEPVTESTNVSVPTSPTGSVGSKKKWSPTKASWLESALNKSDSPKMKPAPPQQPGWMVDISKAKELRGSVDFGKSTSFKAVTTGGLLRSPPMGASLKSPSLTEISTISPIPSTSKAFTSVVSHKSKGLDTPLSPKIATAEINDNNDVQAHREDSARLSPSTQSSAPVSSASGQSATKSPSFPSNEAASLSLPSTRPKPITPPKKDFRSALKSRQVTKETGKGNESEFKNVFGKLKRTETKNYVAPDELKSNIMRGKAGLAATGGPQKSERRDELMESILKKKEEMKSGESLGMTRKTSGNSVPQKPETPIPEALAKRKELGRLESSQKISVPEAKKEVFHNTTSKSSTPVSKVEPQEKKASAPARLQSDVASNAVLGDCFIPALASLLSRGPSPIATGPKETRVMSPTDFRRDAKPLPATSSNRSPESSQLTHTIKARARGPKRRLPTALGIAAHTPAQSIAERSASQEQTDLDLSPPMVTSIPEEPEILAEATPVPLANTTNNTNKLQPQLPSRPNTPAETPAIAGFKNSSNNLAISPKEAVFSKSKPLLPIKFIPSANESSFRKSYNDSSQSSSIDPPKNIDSPTKLADLQTAATASSSEVSAKVTEPGSDANVSVLGVAARWGVSSDHRPQRARSPIKLPTRKDEEAAMELAGLDARKSQDPIGLGIRTTPDKLQDTRTVGRNLPSPPLRSPKSPPLPAKKPASIASRIVSNGKMTSAPDKASSSPVPRTSEAVRLFTDFFDDAPTSKFKANVDTQAVMASRYSAEKAGKIKTLRKQIWEVTNDGKRLPVPSQQEHILFEESIYLCSHVFGSPSGKRTTEVYLWCGDGVAPSAIEDAQLSCRNMGKEAGGKLIVLHQGKESSNFFEALGGIVITRCGSGGRSDGSSSASATYMLCGRRHMGQIAFDEVSFSPNSLCSGFPYIVSATSGRLYLWKGKGSGADELGCARLIGMDLGLTGEIEEIDEDNEPSSFWAAFPSSRKRSESSSIASTYWHLKPSCDKYATRLFSVELESRPKSSSSGYMNMWGRRGSAPAVEDATTTTIREIVPFTKWDLSETGVFVLDGFFEIWVYVCSFLVFHPAILCSFSPHDSALRDLLVIGSPILTYRAASSAHKPPPSSPPSTPP